MTLADALKQKLSTEFIANLIEKNGPCDVNFWGLISDIELSIMEITLEHFKKHKTRAAMALHLNRTTFVEKYKKLKG